MFLLIRSAMVRTTGTLTALPSIAYRLAREIVPTSSLKIPYLVKSSGKPCKRSHLNPAKRNVMVVKNEMRLLKQKRNVLQI